jgi:D-alanyl-D-alanine carboxypeptidase (penicillin-binding protein 5/6)
MSRRARHAAERTTGYWRPLLGGVALLSVLAVLAILRLATETPPKLTIRRTLASTVRFPGPAPHLDWPMGGQAAVEVEGIGSLGSSGDSRPLAIASVAKIMTAYLTLLEYPLSPGNSGFAITVTPADVREERQRAAQDQSVLPVRAGEELTEREALEALLLPSANNVAQLLAYHARGGVEGFLARMNRTARLLGMSATTYTSPSGYDAATVSTASDQLKLAAMAMRIPAFRRIVSLRSVRLPLAGEVANYNGLVGHDGYVGIKTGSDRAAGGCLVFAKRVEIGSRKLTVLGAVLDQREGSLIQAALQSAESLGDSAAKAVHVGNLLRGTTSVLTAASVEGRHIAVIPNGPLRELGWGGLRIPVRVSLSPVPSELQRGQRVATISSSGVIRATTTAVASRTLSTPSIGWRVLHML